MISYKSLMPALLLATLLVGCQNEELDNGLGTSDNLRVQATLGDSSSLRSNALGSDPEQAQFAEGDVIAVSIDEGANWVEYKKVASEWMPLNGKKLSWPSEKEQTEVWAYYPVRHENSHDGNNNSTMDTFTLPRYQCDTQGNGESGSYPDCAISWADRMIFKNIMVRPENNTLSIPMLRQTARVDICISQLNDLWNTDEASFQFGNEVFTSNISIPGNPNSEPYRVYPKGGGKMLKKGDMITCLLLPQEANADADFFYISAYPKAGSTEGMVKYKIKGQPKLEAGKRYIFNLTIGQANASIQSVTIEPWNKNSFADVMGLDSRVMIVKDGVAYIWLDRAKATNPLAQINDSIQSADKQWGVDRYVLYGSVNGKLSFQEATNSWKSTRAFSIDLSSVRDLNLIPARSFKGKSNYPNLVIVNLPSTVLQIQEGAFSETPLQRITAPEVTTIGNEAFYNCEMLGHELGLEFPKVKTVGAKSFYRVGFMAGDYRNITMPELTTIGEEAFASAKFHYMEALNVETIGKKAFLNCSFLKSIDFPKITTVLEETFRGCSMVNSVNLPQVVDLGVRSFYGSCHGIDAEKNLYLPKVKSLQEECFGHAGLIGGKISWDNKIVSEVVFPEVLEVGKRAFLGNSSLRVLSLPKARQLDDFIFSGCPNLEIVRLETTEPITFLDRRPFRRDTELWNDPDDDFSTMIYDQLGDNYRIRISRLYLNANKYPTGYSNLYAVVYRVDGKNNLIFDHPANLSKFQGWGQSRWIEIHFNSTPPRMLGNYVVLGVGIKDPIGWD